MVYDMVDIGIADALGITVEAYVEKVERLLITHKNRVAVLLGNIWSDDEKKVAKACKLFNELP